MIFDTVIGQCHLCGAKDLPLAVVGEGIEMWPLHVCRPCLEDAVRAIKQQEIREQAEATPSKRA